MTYFVLLFIFVLELGNFHRTYKCALISENMRTALNTWAKGGPFFLRQAGVAVTDMITSNRHKAQQQKQQEGGKCAVDYRVQPDAAVVLSACVEKACSAELSVSDFCAFLGLTAEQSAWMDDEDAADCNLSDISRILECIAVVAAADFNPEAIDLSAMSMKEAQLQVQVASSLSVEALEALRIAYMRCKLTKSTSTAHIYVMSKCVEAGECEGAVGALVQNEKRRLSKAEKKKLKSQPTTTKPIAESKAICADIAATSAAEQQCALRYKPMVAILSVNTCGSVTLETADDHCKSYTDCV